MPIFVDFLIICVNNSTISHIRYHVPVNRGFILPTCLQVGLSDSHMYSPSDFLIEEDIFSQSIDLVVGSNGRLSESSSPLLSKNFIQKSLPSTRFPFLDISILHPKADILYFMSHIDTRKWKSNYPIHRIFYRRSVYLTRRHIGLPIRINPGPSFGGKVDVKIFPNVTHLLLTIQQIYDLLLLLTHIEPTLFGIFIKQATSSINEFFIFL